MVLNRLVSEIKLLFLESPLSAPHYVYYIRDHCCIHVLIQYTIPKKTCIWQFGIIRYWTISSHSATFSFHLYSRSGSLFRRGKLLSLFSHRFTLSFKSLFESLFESFQFLCVILDRINCRFALFKHIIISQLYKFIRFRSWSTVYAVIIIIIQSLSISADNLSIELYTDKVR